MYRNGADGKTFSLLFHLGQYLCLLAAPFPFIRIPTILTPRIYSCGLLYMFVSNFIMVAISYHLFYKGDKAKHLSESGAWIVLFAATLICMVSGGIFFSYIPASHRKTFYKQKTFNQHLATYHWNEKTVGKDHAEREIDTNEAIRAILPTWASIHYLPKEKLIDFYETYWAEWVADPPEWFDADFRAMISRELLVKVPPMLWEEAVEEDGESC